MNIYEKLINIYLFIYEIINPINENRIKNNRIEYTTMK